MRRLTALLLLVFAGACTIPMPTVPTVHSAEGRQCVQNCQALYNSCGGGTAAYAFAPFGGFGAGRRATNACRENLGGCYGTCPP
jgi:hypothetical protein